MIRLFATHKTAANLLMLLFVAIGLLSLPGLLRETFPQIPVDEIEIKVVYAGATPEDVEDAICRRIEDAIDGIEGIYETRSEALESLAKVTVQVDEGTDVQVVADDLRTELDAIDDFPEQAADYVLRLIGRTQSVAAIAVVGDMPLRDLKAHCEDLEARLLRDPDVAIVEVSGFSDHQIRIELPALTLMRQGIAAADVANAIRAQSVDLPTGTLQTKDGDVIVRFTDQRRTPLEFADLVVISNATGAEIQLGDIAEITDVFELDEDKVLFNGRRAGLLQIKKTRDQDSLTVVGALERFIADERGTQPRGTDLFLTQDTSSIVRDRLQMLIKNGWQGLLLVFATLWLFFNLRLSFWVAMGLPVSFLGAIFFMTAIGYSINMLTMVALLLALGLLMDDAIVLAENVASHLAQGKDSVRAAVDGVREVGVGVLSSFLTTVVVFLPMAFLAGDIGAVLKVIPVVLILVLAVSLVDAFMILPGHLAHSLHHVDPNSAGAFRRRFDAGIDFVRQAVVGKAVDGIVAWRYLSVGTAILLFMLSVGMLAGGHLKFQAFPEIDGDVVVARVLLPQGTPLARTEAVVERIVGGFERVNEHFRPRQPERADLRRNVSVQFGVNADAFESGPHLATVTIDLLGNEQRDARIDEILARWRQEVGALTDVISVKFTEPAFGPAGQPIEVRVTGDDLAECKAAAQQTIAWFGRFAGVIDLTDDLRPGKPELRLRLRDGASSLGVDAQTVARQLRSGLLGDTVTEIQIGAESYEVETRLAGADRDSVADLDYFHVAMPQGAQIPLGTLATVQRDRGWSRIARIDGRRTVTARGDVDARKANVAELMRQFEQTEVPRLRDEFPAVELGLEGEIKNGNQTFGSLLRGFVIGLLGIFILLSFQFRSYVEPLIVMVAIPMCLIGVVWGHVLMGLDLTMPSMLGFVSLAGVVVNDSILLVEFIKNRRRAGDPAELAARMASRLRFRAVLLTSVTTIAGMFPLLLETSPQAQVLIPLATSIVFGLIASTLMVLLVIPALYAILDDVGLAARAPD